MNGVETLESRQYLVAQPVINEFLASNITFGTDQDQEPSDWIEITNRGDAAIDLGGWHLTDDSANPMKWTFPTPTVVAPGAFLTVWASNKDRREAGAELHTNFRLNNSGEYLGLIQPDGMTAVSEFSPLYPVQLDNVSYGFPQNITNSNFILSNADAKVTVPTDNSLGSSWTARTFNDAAWTTAVTGVGYAATGPVSLQSGFELRMVQQGATIVTTTTQAEAIINGAGPFSFDGTQIVGTVNHGVGGRAGDQAWPNGVLDAAGTTENFVVKATANQVTIPAGSWTIGFCSNEGGYLRLGGINFGTTNGESAGQTAGDNQIRFEGTRAFSCTTGQITLAAATNTSIDALMFDNTAADTFEIHIRSGLQNNTLFQALGTPLADGVTLGASTWTVKTNAPLPAPPFTANINTNLQTAMFGAQSSAYLRVPFTLADVPALTSMKLRMKYDDGFVAYLNGVEIARRNVPAGGLAFNATASNNRSDQTAITFEDIDVSTAIGQLIDGVNVLAIHGLNSSSATTDNGFLLVPELIGSRVDTGVASYMSTPTRGAINLPGFAGIGAGPTFSRASGTYTTDFNVTITAVDGSPIRYTTNGTEPTVTSPLYTGPVPVTITTQVRARTFPAGGLPSSTSSATYIKLAADTQNFSSNLPVLIIDNFNAGGIPGSVSDDNRHKSTSTLFTPDPLTGRTTLTGTPTIVTRSGIETRGSSTGGDAKAQYSLELRNEIDLDEAYEVLGMPSESDWVLQPGYNFDRALIRNPFIYQLSNEIGQYAPRNQFVEVYVNTTGGTVSQADYMGVYSFMENIKRDDNRVAIDEVLLSDNTAPDITGGYMVKIDRCDGGDTGFSAGGIGLCWHEPEGAILQTAAWDAQEQYMIGYINSFGNALNGANFTSPTLGYQQFLDVDRSIDHHILNVLAMNVDALRLSTYLYKPRNGKLTWGPIWDFDRSMESTDGRDDNPLAWNGTGDGTPFFTYPWWNRLFQDANFWQKWIDRWQDLRESSFSTAHINSTIDGMVATINEAQVRNFARWTNVPPRGGFTGEINILKNWLQSRTNWIDGRFTRKPTLSHPGGPTTPGQTVTLTGPAGATIYYTLDGSDPRLAGGGISPTALIYSGTPITITANTRVTSRAKTVTQIDGSTWSGPRIGNYLTEPFDLVITEINYNPSDPTAAEITAGHLDKDLFEFLEVQNRRTTPLNVQGYKIAGGIDFTFPNLTLPAGGKAVIVRNQAAFQFRYGAGITVAGQYGNLVDPLLDTQLDNDGERLIVKGALDNTIVDFIYDDDWYPATDGPGFSLVIVDPAADVATWGLRSSWRPSDFFGGSPTTGDTGIAPPADSLRVTEALPYATVAGGDRVEIQNTSGTPIDLNHWYVTDDPLNVRKYQVSGSTIVPANGFLTLDTSHLGPTFALSNFGGELILQAANASNQFIGFRDAIDYFGTPSNLTSGRYTTSTGQIDFVPLSTSTLGGLNTDPMVGPVVINEIMYHPPIPAGATFSIEDEFIELKNVTNAPVPLFDPLNLANTWSVTGIGTFQFPPSQTIPAQGFAILTNLEPLTFRTRYNVPAAVSIFQYNGSLDNGGEAIGLFRPGTPEVGGVPQILVDRVVYDDDLPWVTEPDGQGSSLSRLVGTNYGNDPLNWLPSTTGGTPGSTNIVFDASPPSVPTNVAATVMTQSRIDLAWTASVDAQSGVSQYLIRRNNQQIGTSATASFTDNTAVPGVAYVYDVAAVNPDSASSAYSTPTTSLTILGITSAVAPAEHTVRVVFSQAVTESVAETATNYTITGASVYAAVLQGDNRTVLLTTSQINNATNYTVSVSNITGTGAVLPPNTATTFVLAGVTEGWLVRDVKKATGTVASLANADALLALPNGDPGIASQQQVVAPVINYKDDDGSTVIGRIGGDSLFPNNATGDDNDYAVRATGTITIPANQAGNWTFATTLAGEASPIVQRGSSWKYLDNGSDQGTAWRQQGFNDSTWSSGLAEFGYGDGDEVTQVSFGPDAANKFVTTYFRKTFDVPNPALISSLRIGLRRDDGAVVYINGVQVVIDGLTAPVTFQTLAVNAADETTFFQTANIPTTMLVAGTNTIAVEVHQTNATSSDVSFDLELLGVGVSGEGPATTDDGVRLRVDGNPVFTADAGVARTQRVGTVNLTAGDHTIELVYFDRNGASQVELLAAPGTTALLNAPLRLVGDTLNGGLVVQSATTPPNQSPFVADVLVSSSQWTPSYLSQLATNGLGSGGVSLARATQLQNLTWSNLNQVKVVFSDDMTVAQGDLNVWGVNVPDYVSAVGVSSFAYDAPSRTATWTFNQPFGADKLLIDLNDSATDTAGAPLDGEWTDGTSRISGNSIPGGDLRVRANVLPGDFDLNGTTSQAEFQQNRQAQFTSLGGPGYVLAQDVDGSGAINIGDWQAVFVNVGRSLPAGTPTPPGGSPAAAADVAIDELSAGSTGSATSVRMASRRLAARDDARPERRDTPATTESPTMSAQRRHRRTRTTPAAHDAAFAE